MRRRWLRLALVLLLVFVLGAILTKAYIRSHPLVFNESRWEHAHCIAIAGLELEGYASKNGGKYPSHPKGYGNALLLLHEESYSTLTGPGYDAAAFHEAKRTKRDLPEQECGRVYIQGLTKKHDSEIALLFDKLPTPGGDHTHLPFRLWAPLGREVWLVGTRHPFVPERDWPEFAKRQVELLVQAGFDRQEAERLYASKPK